MRKKTFVILALWMISGVLILSACKGKPPVLEEGRPPALEREKAIDLIEKINAATTGFQIEVNVAAVEVEADVKSLKENPRYFVTLNNPGLTFNTSVFKEIDYPLPELTLEFDCEKIVFRYGPDDNYLGLNSVSGLSFELDVIETFVKMRAGKELPEKEIPEVIMTFRLGRLTLDDVNLSPILEDKANLFELIAQVATLNQSVLTQLEKLDVEIITRKEETATNQIKISLDNSRSEQKTDPDFVKLMFSKAEESKDKIREFLKEPRTIFDVLLDAEGISFSFKKEGEEEAKVILKKIKFGEYLKPSQEKGFYDFGISFDLQDSSLVLPEKKALETLGRVKQFKKEFNLNHLSPSLIQTYIELIKMAQSLRMEAPEEASTEMASFGLRLMSEIFQSKPVIRFSLSPLEHQFGKLEAEGQFQFQQMGTPPLGKAMATLYDLAGLEERIIKENILPAEKVKEVMSYIKKYVIQDEMGNGKLIFEVREEAPHLFINDNPIKARK